MTKIKYNVNYYNVRNNAWEFLIKNNITSYPLDLRKIANQNGWLIWSYEKYCQVFKVDKNALIKDYPDGFLTQYENVYLICYNENNNKQRNRFTICHEFGHIVLHKIYKGKKLETEANMFSARILMPMLLIEELDITSPEELAKICDVSIEASRFRLKRYNEIKSRNKFYTNPFEKELFNLLKKFIQRIKYKK